MNKELVGKIIMWGLVAIVFIGVSFQACERFYDKVGLDNDNVLEEVAEEVIQQHTGLEIDLTPTSEEK